MPLFSHPSGSWTSINDRLMAILGCVVKEITSINPLPPIRIPAKGGHFVVKEDDPISNLCGEGARMWKAPHGRKLARLQSQQPIPT